MAYTGGRVAEVGMAVSDDLMRWQKIPNNPVTSVDTRFYEEEGSGKRKVLHWRDPCLFEHEGWVYHVVCASRRDGPCDSRGTLGLARTGNMIDWEVMPPPELGRVTQELECPQIYANNGRYFLVFSTGNDWFSQDFLDAHAAEELGWATYSMVGPTPFGPFELFGNGMILPARHAVHIYAGQLVFFQGDTYLLGTYQVGKNIPQKLPLPDGDAICDPILVSLTGQGVQIKTE